MYRNLILRYSRHRSTATTVKPTPIVLNKKLARAAVAKAPLNPGLFGGSCISARNATAAITLNAQKPTPIVSSANTVFRGETSSAAASFKKLPLDRKSGGFMPNKSFIASTRRGSQPPGLVATMIRSPTASYHSNSSVIIVDSSLATWDCTVQVAPPYERLGSSLW